MEEFFRLINKYSNGQILEDGTNSLWSEEKQKNPIVFGKRKGKDRVFGFGTAFLLGVTVATFPLTLAIWRGDKTEIVRIVRSIAAVIDPAFVDLLPQDLESSELVMYQNTVHKFSFSHPAIWVVADSSLDKEKDSSLLDTLVSRDTDKFAETIFISSYSAEDVAFTELVTNLRSNLSSNGYSITEDKEVLDKAVPAHFFEAKGQDIPLKDGSKISDFKSHIYVFNDSSRYLVFEFQDDGGSFDRTSKRFVELINSLKISK